MITAPSPKLLGLTEYLAPLKQLTSFGMDGLSEMINLLKHYSDDVTETPRGLVTVLRLIHNLAIAKQTGEGLSAKFNKFLISDLIPS